MSPLTVCFPSFFLFLYFSFLILDLRREKCKLDSELKTTDLKLLTLYQELIVLQDFETREGWPGKGAGEEVMYVLVTFLVISSFIFPSFLLYCMCLCVHVNNMLFSLVLSSCQLLFCCLPSICQRGMKGFCRSFLRVMCLLIADRFFPLLFFPFLAPFFDLLLLPFFVFSRTEREIGQSETREGRCCSRD